MTIQTGKRITEKDLVRARIPRRFWNVRLGKIPDEMPYKPMFVSYLKNLDEMIDKGIGLYLYSKDNSSGKTSMMVLALKRALYLRQTALFVNVEEFKSAAARDELFDENETVYQRAKRVTLLGLDDVGSEYRTESGYAERLIENLIRYRMQNMLPTIMTSNYEAKELKKVYTPSLSAMLQESARPLHVIGASEGGIDWRRKAEKELRNLLEGSESRG